MSDTGTVAKNPSLPTAQDYLQLRQLAMNFLDNGGSATWTDFNVHDPGITFIEMLAYGITDLAYRQDMPMPTLLAVDIEGDINSNSQTLYTPAQILTISPLTLDDYRILLINIAGIQNAWLLLNTDANGQCGWPLYFDCKHGKLSYQNNGANQRLVYGGLYDVNLLLDSGTDGLGNLNSGSVVYSFSLPYSPFDPPLPDQACGINLEDSYNGYIEMRLLAPGVVITSPDYAALMAAGTGVTAITDVIITVNTSQTTTILPGELQNALSSNLFVSAVIHYETAGGTVGALALEYVPFKVYFDDSNGSMVLTVNDLLSIIGESTSGGIFATYVARLQKAETVIEQAKYALNEHRNYCEDFCNISLIQTEDFAICCDIDASTDADLNQLQAQVYAGIINYFNPPLSFYTWEQLVAQGYSIDKIFNGPRSSCGFLKPDDLDNSGLRTVIYTADIIKIMYTVAGVIGVTNFSLVRIDANGNNVEVRPWEMHVKKGMLPNFYVFGSNIQFYKSSLPFDTNLTDVINTVGLIELNNQRPKMTNVELDVPLPTGQLIDLANYYPLMYSLPEVYNVSPSGPLPPFTPQRYSQANQLQASLLLYEQVYADWLADIANLKLFFNVEDPTLPTYVSRFITDTDLPQVQEQLYVPGYTKQYLQSICQSTREFYDRKDRIYNHLMARFGENNQDYLMISSTLNNFLLNNPDDVLAEKARLLRKYPEESYNKARALDYTYHTRFTSSIVHEGLVDKLCDLLGLDSVSDFFHWQAVPNSTTGEYQLVGNSFNTSISISYNIYTTVAINEEPPAVMSEGYYDQAIRGIDLMLDSNEGGGPRLWRDGNIYIMAVVPGPDNTITEICRITAPYNTLADAWIAYEGLTAELNNYWITNMILPIEHILLRPWGPGEPTLNTCVPETCSFCGDEDPYSFRMTFIMCGESGYQGYDLDFRAYAETLIRTTIPAHILCKICWVSEADCIALSCYYRNYIRLISCSEETNESCGSGSGSGSGINAPAYEPPNLPPIMSGSGSGSLDFQTGNTGYNGWIGGYRGCWSIELKGSGSGNSGFASGCIGDGCGNAACIAEARGILVSKLNDIRSMYPPAVLNNCASGSPAQLVYLGKTII